MNASNTFPDVNTRLMRLDPGAPQPDSRQGRGLVTKPSASAFKSLLRSQEWDGLLNELTKGNMRIAVTNAIPDFGEHGRIPLGICETTR
jgi:hypothetical protein